ncbi:hypothetical protein CBS147311_7121 [Penicillium roqueforti]|nr:hypothetical protein CBS147311_7121 [Penicillium roqueforti]
MAEQLAEQIAADDHHILSEFEDPERKALIARFVESDPTRLSEVPLRNYLALWFSDIQVLRGLVSPHNTNEAFERLGVFKATVKSMNIYDVAGTWAGKTQANKTGDKSHISSVYSSSSDATPASPPLATVRSNVLSTHGTTGSSTPRVPIFRPRGSVSPAGTLPQREADPRFKSLERDNKQCVLTKRGQPTIQTAHIVPNKLNQTTNRHLTKQDCWAWLDAFWGKDRVDQWKAQLLTGDVIGTERVSNLITLEMQTHEYWDRASIAFRPVWVNATNTEMHIAFHWLPFVKDGPLAIHIKQTELVPTQEHIFSDPYYKPRMGPGMNNMLFHTETLKPIVSGYVFKMSTTNAKERPLPSMELLQLKWNLSRIAAMQGAAEDEDSDYESDGGSVAVPAGPRTPVRGRRMSDENRPPFRSSIQSLSPSKLQNLSLEDDNTSSYLVE